MSKPRVTRAEAANSTKRIKIPNACVGLGVSFMTPYEMLRCEQARFVLGVQQCSMAWHKMQGGPGLQNLTRPSPPKLKGLILKQFKEANMADERVKAAGAAGSGAAGGAVVSAVVGKAGLAAMGGAVGIGAGTFILAGAVLGLAGYGLYRALTGDSSDAGGSPPDKEKKTPNPTDDGQQ